MQPLKRTVENASNIPLSKHDLAPFDDSLSHRPHEAPTEAGGMLPRSLAALTALLHLLHALKKSTAARCSGKTTTTTTARAGSRRPLLQMSKFKVQKSKIVLRGTPHYNTCNAT